MRLACVLAIACECGRPDFGTTARSPMVRECGNQISRCRYHRRGPSEPRPRVLANRPSLESDLVATRGGDSDIDVAFAAAAVNGDLPASSITANACTTSQASTRTRSRKRIASHVPRPHAPIEPDGDDEPPRMIPGTARVLRTPSSEDPK
jgi:hypothetical protein